MPPPLLDRLREVRCDREPFTPEHANCVCRLANEAADEIERLRTLVSHYRGAMVSIADIVKSNRELTDFQG